MNIGQEEKYNLHSSWLSWTDMDSFINDWGGTVFVDSYDNTLIDNKGKHYLDLSSGLWNVCLGYSNQSIIASIQKQFEVLPFASNACFSNEPAIKLATKLYEITGYEHSFFTSSGSEAVDTALKMSRQYYYNQGYKFKTGFVSLEKAYHGSTFGALSVCGIEEDKKAFGPLLEDSFQIPAPDCDFCPFKKEKGSCNLECAYALEDLVYEIGTERICSFIAEPILGSGGVIIPPSGYFKTIKRICEKNDILFISDEIATGMGRVGEWLALKKSEVKADLVCMGKGLTGGYAPLSVVLSTSAIYEGFKGINQNDKKFFNHGFTSSGNPIGCVAALKTIEYIEQNDVLTHIKQLEKEIEESLQKISSENSHVKRITGEGLMWGIWFEDRPSKMNPNFNLVEIICYVAKRLNILLFPTNGNCLIIIPSFSFEPTELKLALEKINRILRMVE
ncbi:aminotransferase family protein [Rossellomorea sp. LjRoot5]|uniref:aminotransferase family protein n=1 Tax=Rossellomorea sp. LjRoot5 TaxID=3342331 RepID=UPI003ED12321